MRRGLNLPLPRKLKTLELSTGFASNNLSMEFACKLSAAGCAAAVSIGVMNERKRIG
jgi:hypothetical protein